MIKRNLLLGLSLNVEFLRRNTPAILVLALGVAVVAYVFEILPQRISQQLMAGPTVTETGKITSVSGRWSTVQLPHDLILIPSTSAFQIGDSVEVQHVDGYPGRVKSVRLARGS